MDESMNNKTDHNMDKNSLPKEMQRITGDNLWEVIVYCQGKTFYTKKGLPFTYTVKGGELFTDRRDRSITRSTFEKALAKLQADREKEEGERKITGPKSLNVYGAPYVWAVFMGIGVL